MFYYNNNNIKKYTRYKNAFDFVQVFFFFKKILLNVYNFNLYHRFGSDLDNWF